MGEIYKENGKWKGDNIRDSKAYLFSLRRNGKMKEEPKKYYIKQRWNDWAFVLYKENHKTLFTLGGGNDISVFKWNWRNECYSQPLSFDFNGKERGVCKTDFRCRNC